MDLNKWIEEIKSKGMVIAELGRLKVRRLSLEKKISKFHARIGERVDYLNKLGRSLDDDDILKGLIQEIRNIEKEMDEIDAKIEALRKEEDTCQESQQEEEGGDSSD